MSGVLDRCGPWPDARPDQVPKRHRLSELLLPAGLVAVLVGPATVGLLARPPDPVPLVVTLAGVAALVAVFTRLVTGASARVPWLPLLGCGVLAIGLAARGGPWVPALALVTLAVGLRVPPMPAGALIPALSVLAGALAWLDEASPATVATLLFTPAIMGAFGSVSRRNTQMSAQLRTSERRLTELAVAEERLRIARELHDLLGHSLSLIALKAELAGNLLPADPHRARDEIGDLETVARRSLGEVREAVTGYRRPTLATELATAEQSATSAGIACRIDAPRGYELPEEIDTLLAWTVREGVTNLIRHSGATACTLRLHTDADAAEVEITDNGAGPAGTEPGSGLAGLAERADRLGGRLDTSAAGTQGFRLRVQAPL